MRQAIHAEIDLNFDALQRNLSRYLASNRGSFALMRGGEVIEFFPSAFEAERKGEEAYSDGIYSIQEVTEEPVDLGFFTYAFDKR